MVDGVNQGFPKLTTNRTTVLFVMHIISLYYVEDVLQSFGGQISACTHGWVCISSKKPSAG